MAHRFDDFVLDTERRQLLRGEEEIHLPPRTFRLLEVLLAERPRAVSKRDLMQRVWPDVAVEESNLKTIVSELRTALGNRKYIRTVHRHGYAFQAVAPRAERQYVLCAEGKTFAISEGSQIIGRESNCQVWIDADTVSRHHARITILDRRVTIEDLGSKNGTFVRGTQIADAVDLHDGDRVEIGEYRLIFRVRRASTRSLERA
jgi:DNA-binding winged helix-turn-helix (wHTH) protein